MQTIILVGLGGFVGSVIRYLISVAVKLLNPDTSFPFGTVLVNLVGCFAIGLVGGLSESTGIFGKSVRAFIMFGLLGGFTTFSSFGYETAALMRNSQYLLAYGNIIIQVSLGLAAAWARYALAGSLI